MVATTLSLRVLYELLSYTLNLSILNS